ncbi:hypothetical protein J5N97_002327 [Dioscorea zingiberensis]|uniref:Uncharacterized protein n=1 Tax=Dioscorea zingiberensis TaxID=325984 RepID=A0A9D5HPI3_9LILI|nr:hypothetical protein J5N97_002327 [Dioscorea zingiberensis]
MTLPFLPAALRVTLLRPRPLLVYAVAWTALLTSTVAVASFAPEIAFVWAMGRQSSLGAACGGGTVRVPLEGPPGEVLCVPAQLFGRSKMELFVPPLFAAMVVAGSACFVRAIGLWETDEETIS